MRRPVIYMTFLLLGSTISAQLSVYNLAEYQYGNIPGAEPADLNTFYDQLNVQYRWKPLRASVRIEQFYSPDSLSGDYQKISQFQLNYRKRGLDIKLGHFYESLGRGLLLRGYEINNAVYEDLIYRVKQGFYKDFQGAYVGYNSRYFAVKAMSGRMLNNQLAITDPKNRDNYINAGEVSGRYKSFSVGSAFLNSTVDMVTNNFATVFTSGTIGNNLNFYGELASLANTVSDVLNMSDDGRYGAYFSASYSLAGFGASLEIKDYQNFFIGTGYSDPPTLSKEHSYRLLNRITHFSDLTDEAGYQLEVFWAPAEAHLLTFNHSRNVNELYNNFTSFEYFIEYYFTLNEVNQIKLFVDYSADDIKFEPERFTGGLYYTRYLNKGWSLNLETEAQQLSRAFPGLEKEQFINLYGGFTVNYTTKLAATFVLEFTNDPVDADASNTAEIETQKLFPGASLLYRPNNSNTLQLFAGERRGGPACTAGICYEVLDFKGIELRWIYKY